MEEDEYFDKIEEIIRRDFYPDLIKVEALQEYEANGRYLGSRIPSVLLKSTGKSRITHKSEKSNEKGTIQAFIAHKRKELGLDENNSTRSDFIEK